MERIPFDCSAEDAAGVEHPVRRATRHPASPGVLRTATVATLVAAGLAAASPAQAAGVAQKTFTCPRNAPPGTDYVTVILSLDKLEIPTSATDAGAHFDIRTWIDGAVRPSEKGPISCAIPNQSWYQEFPIPNIASGPYWAYPLGYRLVVTNVPRSSILAFQITMMEEDTTIGASNSDDRIDLNPLPGVGWLEIGLSPATGRGRVNPRNTTTPDIVFGKRKRVVGDGSSVLDVDFAVGLEFTATLVDQPEIAGAVPAPKAKSPGLPSPGQAVAARDAACRDYALKAVEANVEQLKLGCGFQPPVWSNDHQRHFDWCMQGANDQFIGAETKKRSLALKDCRQAKQATQPPPQPPAPPGLVPDAAQAAYCDTYANEAVRVAAMADALGCGFTGPRWLQNYAAHRDFCLGQQNPTLMNAEHDARFAEYQACKQRLGQPGAGPAPMPPAGGFVFADSHLRRLSSAELAGLSKQQLWQARNEIFARKGYIFTSAKAKAFFSAMPWYQPLSNSVALNANEQANVALIQSFE